MSEYSDESHSREAQYNEQIKTDLNRNFIVHLVHGMFGQTGFRLLNAPTFLPAYVMMLSGGSEIIVGLALSLQSVGMTITPLIGANLIEHRKKVLPIGIAVGMAMRLFVLFIALAGFLLEGPAVLVAVLVCLALFGLFGGMQGVVFNVLLSKVIPVSKRGRLVGLRNFMAGITSAGVAWLGGEYLLGETPTVAGYSSIFLVAFVLTSIGLLFLTAVREPEPPIVKNKQALLNRLREIPELLRSDPAFTRYFLARSLATMGRMAMPFYILYAGSSIGLTGQTLGLMTFAFTISGTISNLVWGLIADHRGFRLVFLSSIVLWIVSTLLLMWADGLAATIFVFVGIGAAVQGFQVSSINLTLEFGDRANLPMRLAIANSGSEIAGSIGPLVGGVMAAFYGYQSVFLMSIMFLVVGGLVVGLYVPEPRHANS